MSEKDLLEEMMSSKKKRDQSIEVGTPFIEHKKKQARIKKEKAEVIELFTVKENKVLKIKVTKANVYSEYIGDKKRMGEQFKVMMKEWIKENKFVNEYELKIHIDSLRSEMK